MRLAKETEVWDENKANNIEVYDVQMDWVQAKILDLLVTSRGTAMIM